MSNHKSSKKALEGPKYDVTYHGFVHVKPKSQDCIPSVDKVKTAAHLLQRPKEAHAIHPLFARGFDSPLTMTINHYRLNVTVLDKKKEVTVFDHPLHKIARVCSVKRYVYFISKTKHKDATFKCHGFQAKKEETAEEMAAIIANYCNEMFKKLKKTWKAIKARTINRVPDFDWTSSVMPEEQKKEKKAEQAKLAMESLRTALQEIEEEDLKEEEGDESEGEYLDILPQEIKYEEYSDDFVKLSLNLYNLEDDKGEVTLDAEEFFLVYGSVV